MDTAQSAASDGITIASLNATESGLNATVTLPPQANSSVGAVDSSSDDHEYHHGSSDCGRHRHDRTSDDATAQNASLSDNDGVEQAKLTGLLVAGAVVLLIAVAAFLWKRRRKSVDAMFSPTPSVILHLQMRSPSGLSHPTIPSRPIVKVKRPSTSAETARSSICSDFPTISVRIQEDHQSLEMTSAWVDPVVASTRIPIDKISIGHVIGRGGFGEVFRGSYDGRLVAVKRLLPDRRKDIVHIEAFLREAKFISKLDHPHIVKFIGVGWASLSDLCVVSELMEGGDLRSLLNVYDRVEHRPKGFDSGKTRIALHITQALVYLHSRTPAVVHRDLKSRNVLLDRQHNAKLADFGVSRERIDSTMTSGVGSVLWMAPELMMGKRYDEKADMFSFGVLLSELDTHLPPYHSAREHNKTGKRIPECVVVQMVTMGKLQVDFSLNAGLAANQIVQLALSCVSVEPQNRPTAAQAHHRLRRIFREMEAN